MATSENWFNRRKGKTTSDVFKLDIKNKTPKENVISIIEGLYLMKPFHHEVSPTTKTVPKVTVFRGAQRSSSDTRKLSYLNALVTLLGKEDISNLGFTADELMTCIRISLVDESMVLRAAALRVLRYLIRTESDVATFNNLRLPYLVTRSMDLMLRNEEERAQALRVVRRVVAVVGCVGPRRLRAARVDEGLLRCLAAVARAGAGDGSPDRLARPAVATLAEICVLNPDLFIACGGVTAVTRQLAECATPHMAEALCGVLLHTLNEPAARDAARIDLACLSFPYCDFHNRPQGDANKDEREMRFTCSRLALLCVLRSWPGLLHFCHPRNTGGLRAMVSALYLPRLEVRKAILDLLYELVGLPQPEWTDEISVALDAVDPSDFQDSWRLNEGFVAAEGTAILPHLSATGSDITEIHLALLLQCFLEAGLLDGLTEVIVTSDTFISVRATVLLGQLLHLVHALLPPQACGVTPALPQLLSAAAGGRPQALAAVAALRRLHAIHEARPATHSLFLDHVVQYCSGAYRHPPPPERSRTRKEIDDADVAKPRPFMYKDDSVEFLDDSDNDEPKRHSVGSRADVANRNYGVLVKSKSVSSRTGAAVSKVTKSAKFFNLFDRDSDNLIRCTLVMQNKDGNTWNWEFIRTILKENDTAPLLNLCDSGHKAWVARIVNYLKPSSNKYSHTDLSTTSNGHSATRAGCQLIRHLLRHNDADSQRLLEELFWDVSRQVEAIETGRRAHECLFSPQHMSNTMCQMYFLFIGQLCHSHAGLDLLKQTKLYDNLLELSTKTHHSCYVKLVISSLDYTLDSYPRDILAKTLTCSIQASRLYATQFLTVLLRASQKSKELVRRRSKLKKNLVQEHLKSSQREEESSGVDMDTWLLQMLIAQLKDESKSVVKCAVMALEEAYSVPALLEKLVLQRDVLAHNCRFDKNTEPSALDLSVAGDRGYLIWLGLEIAAAAPSQDLKAKAFIKKHVDFWIKNYNYRYVRLVEAAIHDALALCSGGGGARARARRTARPPPHAFTALARVSHLARAMLPQALQPALAVCTDASDWYRRRYMTHWRCASHRVPQALATSGQPPPHALVINPTDKVLQRKTCATEQEIMDVKASLWAVGNAALHPLGLQQLLSLTNPSEESIPVRIVSLAKHCPVYSVRATAFYVLGLIGSTYEGANLLSDLGWLCVRHTRHDQFPIIQDEFYAVLDPKLNFIASPERRFQVFDAEASEHSDHTDLSESLHSEISKPSKIHELSQDMVDSKLNIKEPDKRKSHTLPSQGASISRTLMTESRTVDILRDFDRPHRNPAERLIGRMNSLEHAHEGRVRNTSESSTSGVSSCDSVLGKYTIPDRVLTLSPIPSSSSLYGMKGSSGSHRPRLSETQRRTSSSSFTAPDVSSSPPSQLDMSGYATLISLNKHRRPHLSESAASGSSDMDDLSWLLSDTHRRSKPFSSLRDRAKSTRERMAKLSLLDYDWKPLAVAESGTGETRAPRLTPTLAAPAPAAAAGPPPHYIGICLPRDLHALFPSELHEIDADEKDPLKVNKSSTLLNDASIASTEKPRSSKCLEVDVSSSTDISRISSATVTSRTLTDKNKDAKENEKIERQSSVERSVNDSISNIDKEGKETDGRWKHAANECLACVRTRPPSSHELREAFFLGLEGGSGDNARVTSAAAEGSRATGSTPQAELLNHVRCMSNPIYLRQTRSAVLTLKQKHPDVFRSACVYSDVCGQLARATYLMCARRFLHELFLDATFECFADEPRALLARHAPITTVPEAKE
ncbi:rapamycin-insensitive companion of mTOR [Leguminivora glycinivorella]|uniref:rapamycin-insensitive companion of mTOR n=1 Tax=Leguminivora glycinivorella TaxID=1035111 RepID=UPI00200DE3B0|nr:rapamycin-insensitive companion of mTOR [Leguminivora glycinivorella]